MGRTALIQKEMLQGRNWASGPGDPSTANGKKGVIFKEIFFLPFTELTNNFLASCHSLGLDNRVYSYSGPETSDHK